MTRFTLVLTFLILQIFLSQAVRAQLRHVYGDEKEIKKGVHSHNEFRTTFCNDGTYGVLDSTEDYGGEWPINSGHLYLEHGVVFVGSEVVDAEGNLQRIVSESRGPSSDPTAPTTGDRGPNGEWWTFLPLPGFANPDFDKIAISSRQESWPALWLDKIYDSVDPGWAGAWNGYFGKDVFYADEESFYVADDAKNAEFDFFPDSTNLDRRGLGLRMYVRNLQWQKPEVEDVLFTIFDFENAGTYNHKKMVFGFKVGADLGASITGSDAGDDMGGFNKNEALVFLYDFDDLGNSGWKYVGYFGSALLETPGNPHDGIDNDGDGASGEGDVIMEKTFEPKTLRRGDPIVVINYDDYSRRVDFATENPIEITFHGVRHTFQVGQILGEIAHNGFDDNLNGLIDENNYVMIGQGDTAYLVYLNIGLKYIDYFTNIGMQNRLIDESRNDGIDNDGDWDPATDDVGEDGRRFSVDAGENDGQPTNGEPDFDKTDVSETDMLGLTSFCLLFREQLPHWNDEIVWNFLLPGNFNMELLNNNIDMVYGSGYFPLDSHDVMRVSQAFVMGTNRDDFMTNAGAADKFYADNYVVPNVNAVQNKNDKPASFILSPNYPNPFNSSTTIRYSLKNPAHVKIAVYNSNGQKVKTLVDKNCAAGSFSAQWNGENETNELVSSGVYLVSMEADKFRASGKMLLVK